MAYFSATKKDVSCPQRMQSLKVSIADVAGVPGCAQCLEFRSAFQQPETGSDNDQDSGNFALHVCLNLEFFVYVVWYMQTICHQVMSYLGEALTLWLMGHYCCAVTGYVADCSSDFAVSVLLWSLHADVAGWWKGLPPGWN